MIAEDHLARLLHRVSLTLSGFLATFGEAECRTECCPSASGRRTDACYPLPLSLQALPHSLRTS